MSITIIEVLFIVVVVIVFASIGYVFGRIIEEIDFSYSPLSAFIPLITGIIGFAIALVVANHLCKTTNYSPKEYDISTMAIEFSAKEIEDETNYLQHREFLWYDEWTLHVVKPESDPYETYRITNTKQG